ncbi:unnamed protein product [Chrysoparadoxa australica]
MGGGNGQKSAVARARNAEKKAKAAKGSASQMKSNASNLTIICKICRQSFAQKSDAKQLQTHVDAKHSKLSGKDCFPDKFGG